MTARPRRFGLASANLPTAACGCPLPLRGQHTPAQTAGPRLPESGRNGFELVRISDALRPPECPAALALDAVSFRRKWLYGGPAAMAHPPTGHDRPAAIPAAGGCRPGPSSSWEFALRLQAGGDRPHGLGDGSGAGALLSFSEGPHLPHGVRLRRRPAERRRAAGYDGPIATACGDQQLQPLDQPARLGAMLRCRIAVGVSGPLWIAPLQTWPHPPAHGPQLIPAWAAKPPVARPRLATTKGCQPAAGPHRRDRQSGLAVGHRHWPRLLEAPCAATAWVGVPSA